ncbi:MAG: SDR family NAD(P)-dependent oxidoreductase [Chthoniobacterales bacterium]|nr:SDR family NAD(P)-dependent oxidoreductase [Chthoniobacterales bacterium]
MQQEQIAIIGMGLRFPGGLNNVEDFWKFLDEGRDAVVEIPPDRWNIARFYDPQPGLPGKSMAKHGGFINGIDLFDPQFFGISPREAPFIDPQQRLLLETAWEAIEDAGIVLDQRNGTDIGVFAGISHTDYQNIQGGASDRTGISAHSPTGNAHSIAANRISYCLNLTGPSIAMDTACSSALTAVHVACEHLRERRCAAALAGGVTVMITPDGFIGFSQASMLSPDGRCRAFDASANGFVRGEGAGMVLLKPLSKALEDGDPIYAIIRGTSANQDGHTNGIMLPGEEAQARLVREACADAGIDPLSVGYVEAHGTGTAVGDPIEAHALSRALCPGRADGRPLVIGSVKTNLGHLETAAGVAGLIKAALVVNRGRIPANIHFTTPSPHIDFGAAKLRVPTRTEDFPGGADAERIAGVNSFGFGGANAHVIVSEPPKQPRLDGGGIATERAWPVTLSARSEESLKAAAAELAAWIDAKTASNGGGNLLCDLAYTLGARRNHHAYRLTGAPLSASELSGELRSFVADGAAAGLKSSFAPQPEKAPRVGFVMSGQGPQWWGMGRELMRTEKVFRETMEACARAMAPHASFSLLEELAKDENETRLAETEVGQPAIFAMQIALSELWKSWGITPSLITGHSVGELAAVCVAGILSLDVAARIIVMRARFMSGCARNEGAMLAVGLPEDEVLELISRHDPAASIAAFNGPRSLTIAGLKPPLEKMAAELEARGVFNRFVRVQHPFHHALMQPAAAELEKALAGLQPEDGTIPFFSTVTGALCPGRECTASYWASGIRNPVRFVSAVKSMAQEGVDVWLEISAHPALALSIQECLADNGVKAPVVSSTRREREQQAMMEAALEMNNLGATVDFAAMIPSRTQLVLPSYPWKKERWWHESSDVRSSRLAPGGRGLLDARLPRSLPTWSARLDERHMAYLRDHRVDNHIVFPAAGFIAMVLEAGVQLFEGRPFAIEDFEIRKPLILPEAVETLVMELSYDPAERSFTIQSRFEPSTTWSVHVVGSLRAERVESSFEATRWRGPEGELDPADIDEHYEHKRNRGLRYGPEFRAARELFARNGESAGLVTLSEVAAQRAAEYALHPVIMDGALHVFSAGARTVESRGVKLKLPVRFSRILYLRPPGAACRVRARVLNCNDELTEGRIGVYDTDGAPCVLADGFRAVALSSARRAGSPTGEGRELVYHVDWERCAADSTPVAQPPLPLAALHESAASALDAVLDLRGKERLEAVMVEEDAVAAAQVAAGLRGMGVNGGSFTADSLRVAPGMRRVFQRLAAKLAKRGLLEECQGESWRTRESFGRVADSAPHLLRDFLARVPGHTSEGLLCAATGAEFGSIMRGEKDAVQVLFAGAGTDWLEQFYGDGLYASHWLAAIGAAVRRAADSLPEGRGLRILEVGAGTAGLASHVLSQLERGLHTYVFSDVSTGFFSAAQQKLAAFPEVEYRIYNLDRSPAEQDFEDGTFDFIVGTNVLHAAADLRSALRNLHGLLAPGGTLAFMDVASPRLWTESIFGLTSGWWNLKDSDLRPEHPLLSRQQWEEVLRDCGFSEVASLPGMRDPEGGEGQIGVLARKAWAAPKPELSQAAELDEKSWVVFADDHGFGDALAVRLRECGARCRVVKRGETFASADADTSIVQPDAPENWRRLIDDWSSADRPQRFVYFWSLDAGDSTDALMGTDAFLHLAHALEIFAPHGKVRLDLVTRGAQPAGRDPADVSPAAGACIGLFRVFLSEHPSITSHAIDLPPVARAGDGEMLWSELQRKDAEREVALRGEARYVQRLARGLPLRDKTLGADVPMRLESRERGSLDSLKFTAFAMPAPGPGEVLIRVKAAALNFRDVLKALGLYPAETADARMFGDEVGGEIVAVGDGVGHVKVGDRVFGLAVFGLATHTLARAADVRCIPEGVTFEEAATVPVVFMTAWHSLKNVARLRKGETVLVHSGAGGVGMAAIQIARHLGAKVIASAGSQAKRSLLSTLGVDHVVDSRRGDFAERVMELTGGKGVDVVLNALAGEAIPMGLSCLAEFGRFIEIGKRDIYQNSKLPLWHMRRNVSFHVVAMDAVFAGDEELTRELLAEIAGLMEQGALRPLPYRSFPACRADAAFRLMAAGKHTGKVLLAFAEPFLLRRGAEPHAPFAVDPDATYLVTGGFGGFGKVLARWLATRGARHLVLAGRRGIDTDGAKEFVAELEAAGVTVLAVKADAGSAEDTRRAFSEIRATKRPLKGVFHLAMAIDDAPLSELTPERFATVLQPKALGALHLHEETKSLDLDAFVLFSSASSVFGNPGQGNYAAANAFLDSLAHHRRSLGLPALAVNWGVLGGDGYVARNEKVAEYLLRQGTAALEPSEVTSILESFLDADATQAAAMRVDWAKWRQAFRGLQENRLLERIFAAGVELEESAGKTGDWRLRIEAAPADAKEAVIVQALQEVVGSVLRVKPDSLRPDQPLTDLGLDSLMGVEIENLIEASIGVALPPTSLMRARTIGQIASLIHGHLGGEQNPAAAAPAAVEEVSLEEVDLDALADVDLGDVQPADRARDGKEARPVGAA